MTRWYSTQEVAELLGVSSETVRRFIAKKLLGATVISAGERPTYRISEAALADFRRRHVHDSLADEQE
jgi:excisionase family DNA binding protein